MCHAGQRDEQPVVGSSKKMMVGLAMRAQAMVSRRFSPPAACSTLQSLGNTIKALLASSGHHCQSRQCGSMLGKSRQACQLESTASCRLAGQSLASYKDCIVVGL